MVGGAFGFFAPHLTSGALFLMPLLIGLLIALAALVPRSVAFVATAAFAAGFVGTFLWLLVPARARCRPPACQVALTPAQDVLWLAALLAIPIVVILAVLAIREARRRLRDVSAAQSPQ